MKLKVTYSATINVEKIVEFDPRTSIQNLRRVIQGEIESSFYKEYFPDRAAYAHIQIQHVAFPTKDELDMAIALEREMEKRNEQNLLPLPDGNGGSSGDRTALHDEPDDTQEGGV